MGYFYVDESIHDEAEFIVCACVYTDSDINPKILEVFRACGLDGEAFEYKSRVNYSKEPQMAEVRDELRFLLAMNTKLGIVVVPRNKRNELGYECLKAIQQFIENNNIKAPIEIYFDQGVLPSRERALHLIDMLNLVGFSFHLEQDSKQIKGIQLADLAAHIASIQLKCSLGLITKLVKAGENSGYESDVEFELGFEMWAALRYTFFNEGPKESKDSPVDDATLAVEPYGLYISEFCDKKLSEKARNVFGEVYLGCIH